MPVAEVLDRTCADAVDLARAAAIARGGVMGVGDHLGVVAEDVRVATHLFACPHPGYPGWSWLMPTPDNEPRVGPGFVVTEVPPSHEPAEWSATRAVVAELGLGRERVLSPYGRDEAVERWVIGPGGPDNPMTHQAPASCETCAYFVALSGPMGRVFGVCANEYTPSDGRVVSREHGCGAHSDVVEPTRSEQSAVPAWDTMTVDF